MNENVNKTHIQFLPEDFQFLRSLDQISVGLGQTQPLHLHLAEDLHAHTHARTHARRRAKLYLC